MQSDSTDVISVQPLHTKLSKSSVPMKNLLAENLAILNRYAGAEAGLVKKDETAFDALVAVRRAVTFDDGVGVAFYDGMDDFLKLSPFPILRKFIESSVREYVFEAVGIIGDVVTGSTEHTSAALSAGALEMIEGVVTRYGGEMTDVEEKGIMWIISNIAGGSFPQCEKLMGRPLLVDTIIGALQHKSREVASEASFVFINLLDDGNQKELTTRSIDSIGIVLMAIYMAVFLCPNALAVDSREMGLVEAFNRLFGEGREEWDNSEANEEEYGGGKIALGRETSVQRDKLAETIGVGGGVDIASVVAQTRIVWKLLRADAKSSRVSAKRVNNNLSFAMWGIFDFVRAGLESVGQKRPR